MTWTYIPVTRDLDHVRLLIGDTNSSSQQLQDEEILYFITEAGGVYGAAVMAARALESKYSSAVDKKVGDLSLSSSQKAAAYAKLVRTLTVQQAMRGAMPYAGGISRSDKRSVESNTDRVAPAFVKEVDDYVEPLDYVDEGW